MSERKGSSLAYRVNSLLTSTFQPTIDALGSTLTGELTVNGYRKVEINGGMHGAHTKEGAEKIRERFKTLREQLEYHLQNGAKVAYIAEDAMFTTEQSQRVRNVLQHYPQVTPSDAIQAVLTGVDHLSPDTWSEINTHFYQAEDNDPFNRAQMIMVDDLAKQYPDQFIFIVEGGSKDRILKSQKAVRDLRDNVPYKVQKGDFENALRQYQEACVSFVTTQAERDQAVAAQITNVVDEIYEPDFIVVASFGSEHIKGINAALRVNGIMPNIVETTGGYLDSPDMTVKKAIRREEEISNLLWMQSLIGHSLFADTALISTIFSGKEWDETVTLINNAISRHLPTEESIAEFQQKIQQNGWNYAAFELLAPETILKEKQLHTDRAIALMVEGDKALTDPQTTADSLLGYEYGLKFIRVVITLEDGLQRSIVVLGGFYGDHNRLLAGGMKKFRQQFPTITKFIVQDAGSLVSRKHGETLELTFSGGSSSLSEEMRSAQRARSLSNFDIRKETEEQLLEFFEGGEQAIPVNIKDDPRGFWY